VSLRLAAAILDEADFVGVGMDASDLAMRGSGRSYGTVKLVIDTGPDSMSVERVPGVDAYWKIRGLWDDDAVSIAGAARVAVRLVVYDRLSRYHNISAVARASAVKMTRAAVSRTEVSDLEVTGLGKAPMGLTLSDVTLLVDNRGASRLVLGRGDAGGGVQRWTLWDVSQNAPFNISYSDYAEETIRDAIDHIVLRRLGIGRRR
jgi:hypothetical protein